MRHLESIWERGNRTRVTLISAALVLAIAVADWWTKPYMSLGFFYLFPIMLVAGFLPRSGIILLGMVCAVLAEEFSALDRSFTRLSLEALALAGCGLFVGELIRNRRITIAMQERLSALVETSPAAIVTVNEYGIIELANRAAIELMSPRDNRLIGHPIGAFLPELHHILKREAGPHFRTSMHCSGHRDDSESFTSNVWFSTYTEGARSKLAAIITETAEEPPSAPTMSLDSQKRIPLSIREIEVLRFLVQGLANKEIAVRMGTSESTVKNTFQQLFAKAGVRTRSQLVRVTLEDYGDLL